MNREEIGKVYQLSKDSYKEGIEKGKLSVRKWEKFSDEELIQIQGMARYCQPKSTLEFSNEMQDLMDEIRIEQTLRNQSVVDDMMKDILKNGMENFEPLEDAEGILAAHKHDELDNEDDRLIEERVDYIDTLQEKEDSQG